MRKLEPSAMTDEELFDAIREQFNKSRYGGGHDRNVTRAISEEATKRGWSLGRKPESKAPNEQ